MGAKAGMKVFAEEMVVALQPNVMVKQEKERKKEIKHDRKTSTWKR